MNIRLYNAKILTMEKHRPIFEGEIWVKNDKIVYVAEKDKLKEDWMEDVPQISWDMELDCKKNLLMPGFKNAHTHSAMTFLRSYADDLPLDKWLHEKIFPMEEKLTSQDAYTLNKLAILEYLSGGITAVFDMYMFPEATAKACQDMGMRLVLVSGLNDFTSSVEQMEKEYLLYNQKNSLISYHLGFHAEYTCSKELLMQVAALAHKYKTPVYAHIGETQAEVESCKQKYGMPPVMFLDSLGMFEFGGGGYHLVHVTEEEMEILKRRRLHVITNPASNLKLASGIAPIAEYEKRKIPVAIGTDGPASNNCLDMFREMFLVSGLSKVREGDAAATKAERVLRMATVHGAKAMGLSKADVLAKGKYADIIMIDLHKPNLHPLHNIEDSLVYSANKSDVLMTMIGGKILYRNGEYYIGESVDDIYEKTAEIIKNMASR